MKIDRPLSTGTKFASESLSNRRAIVHFADKQFGGTGERLPAHFGPGAVSWQSLGWPTSERESGVGVLSAAQECGSIQRVKKGLAVGVLRYARRSRSFAYR
jgi:hypothetical protein